MGTNPADDAFAGGPVARLDGLCGVAKTAPAAQHQGRRRLCAAPAPHSIRTAESAINAHSPSVGTAATVGAGGKGRLAQWPLAVKAVCCGKPLPARLTSR